MLLSKPSAAFELSLDQEQIQELIDDGELVAVHLRGQYLVTYDSLQRLVGKLRRAAWRGKSVGSMQ